MNSLIIAMGLLCIDEPEHVFVHDDLSEYEPSLKRAKLSNDNNFDKPFVVPKFDALTDPNKLFSTLSDAEAKTLNQLLDKVRS